MSTELTNLLPDSRARDVRRAYFVRLATVAVVAAIVLLAIDGLLGVPTYLYLQSKSAERTQRLADLSSQLAKQDTRQVNERTTMLNTKAAFLSGLASKPLASTAVSLVLGIPRTGVTLTSFTYTAPKDKKPATMTVTGSAATRDALRNYQLALQGAAFISSADLPVSAYAKDTDIPFTITLTGSFASSS